MTRGIAETRRRLVEWPLKYDAHTWPRSADRRTLRPTGRGEYGYNRVQEIVSGTVMTSWTLYSVGRNSSASLPILTTTV